jgi:hypothetical protein
VAYKIFICYRHAESVRDAQFLQVQLNQTFGAANVFFDGRAMEGGDYWPEELDQGVRESDAMLVLIGNDWLDLRDRDDPTRRRLDNSEDWVRKEIALAFQKDLLVIPVLIDGVPMPDPVQLPANIRRLAYCQPMYLHARRLSQDTDEIVDRLRKAAASARVPMRKVFLVAAVALPLTLGAGVGALEVLQLREQVKLLTNKIATVEVERDTLRNALATANGAVKVVDERVGDVENGQHRQSQLLADAQRTIAELSQQLADAHRLIKALSQQRVDDRRDIETLSRRVTLAENRPQGIPPPGVHREIVVTIDGVPRQYDDKAVSRLVLSTLRGGLVMDDVIAIRPKPTPARPGRAGQRVVSLIVRDKVALTVARKGCRDSSECSVKLALRPWYVDLKAGDLDEPRLVAGTRLQGATEDDFYSRLGVKDVELPKMTSGGYAIVYLLHDAYFRIDLNRASGPEKAPGTNIVDSDNNLLSLVGEGPNWSLRIDQNDQLPSLPRERTRDMQ